MLMAHLTSLPVLLNSDLPLLIGFIFLRHVKFHPPLSI